MKKIIVLVLAFISFLPLIIAADSDDKSISNDLDALRNCSVMVNTKTDTQGTGVVKTRKIGSRNYHFIWTAGHLITKTENVRTIIDPYKGTPKVIVEYPDVTISKFIVQDGRQVGYLNLHAKIIRYSNRKTGNDLALMVVRAHDVFKKSIEFNDNSVPEVGAPVWHIGSMDGDTSPVATTDGLVSNIGLIRHNCLYDQITVPALHGCSGGGVFLKSNGKCIGLLLERAINETDTINFIRPTREIRAWAKKAKCLWAVDDTVAVPSIEDIEKDPVNVDGVEPPKPEKKEPSIDSIFASFFE
jgi:hypothetical protein